MNIQRLGLNVKAEQQTLKALEAKAIGRQVQAKAAKAKARAAKLDYKQMRAAAKKAKARLLEAEAQVERQRRILAKAQKGLAKALRKAPGAEKARKSVIAGNHGVRELLPAQAGVGLVVAHRLPSAGKHARK
jgi:multidrug efflux pump subunit AcrA (membrane-fusion protein)